ncbi:MAG: hypothetical protein R2715_00715 [Ilumatobacteraceae bacterium]
MSDERRVALIPSTSFYIGPPLARLLAARGHDLVIADPADGLVEELESLGASGGGRRASRRSASPESIGAFVALGLERFRRIDAAA